MPHDAPGGEPPPGPGGGDRPEPGDGAPPPPPDRPQYNVYRAGEDGPPEHDRPDATDRPDGADRPVSPDRGERPDYHVYRSRRRLRDRLGPSGGSPLEALRRRRAPRPVEPGPPGHPRVRRFFKWVAIAIVSWILLSIVVFMVSAQTAPSVTSEAKNALSGRGSLVTGSNVLVLGSDQRSKGTKEPGATTSGPSRSDSILLLHVGLGTVRKVAILRDSYAAIPGHKAQKINAAFAIGGSALTIKTVEGFMGNGLKINHLILVSFTNFPKLIDALGGIDITLENCVRSAAFGGKKVTLTKGDHHLTGRQALRFARVRKNKCAPNEDDRARAARQQQVLGAMRAKIVSPSNWPSTFVRLPLVSWEAPRALRTDLRGPGLMTLFSDLLTGGAGATSVLRPSGVNSDGSLRVTPEARARAVDKLLHG